MVDNINDPFEPFENWLVDGPAGDWPKFFEGQKPLTQVQTKIVAANVKLLLSKTDWRKHVEAFGSALAAEKTEDAREKKRAMYEIRFTGHVFYSSEVDINSGIFPCDVYFEQAEFRGKAEFMRCRFKGNAFFQKTKFARQVLFADAKFCGIADFSKSEMCIFADVNHPDREMVVDFSNVTFSHALFFQFARVGGRVSFKVKKIGGAVCFSGTKFYKEISWAPEIGGTGEFAASGMSVAGDLKVASEFNDKVDLSKINVEGTASFAGCEFKQIPDFMDAKFNRPPEVARMVVPRPKLENKRWWQFRQAVNFNDVGKLRKLKSMALQANDHEKDGEFFAKEMLAKRGVETTSFSGLLFNTLYWKLSDFGQDFIRPLKAMFVSFLVFMVVHYSIVYCWVETTTKTTSWNQLGFALEMSIRNVIPVLGGLFGALPRPTNHQGSFMTTYLDLARNGVDADWLVIIGIVQNIIGAVLLFLFLLALRNKFRLK